MPQDPLIDLPLPGESDDPSPDRPSRRRAAPPPRRRSWWIVLLVVAAAAAGYFVPRPGPPVVATAVDLLEVPEQRVGSAGPEWPVEIRNEGRRALLIGAAELEGVAAAAFRITNDGCSETRIEAQSGCHILLVFEPEAAGTHEVSLVVASNAPNSPFRLPIRGSAVEPVLTLAPDRLDFPALLVGEGTAERRARLRNEGSSVLEIGKLSLPGADFRTGSDGCSGQRLEPGAECEVAIVFSPQSAGTRRAALEIPSDAASGTAQLPVLGEATAPRPTLVVSSEQLDFGTRRADEPAASDRLTLRNAGTGTLRISDLTLSTGAEAFKVELARCRGTELAQNQECHVGVSFQPGGEGRFAATLRVATRTAGIADVTLRGEAVLPRLVITPTSLDFGQVPVNGERTLRAVRLHNGGSAPLVVRNAALIAGGSRAFEVANDRCSRVVLDPGDACQVEVGFRASQEGVEQARLAIQERDSENVNSVYLKGEGVRGRLELSATALDLGTVEVGQTARASLVLTNAGAAPLAIREVLLDGGGRDFRIAVDGCRSQRSLAPEAFCTVIVELSPSAAGATTATLQVRHDGRGGPASVRVRGRATLPAVAQLEIAPEAIDFGAELAGARGAIRTVTIRNEGNGRLELGSIRVGGTSPGDFRIVPATCVGLDNLAPGGSCTVGVRFAPEGPPGRRDGHLLVSHGAATDPATVALSGVVEAVAVEEPGSTEP